MPDYYVYGGRLRTELPIPELRPAASNGSPDWVFETSTGQPPLLDLATPVGEEHIFEDIKAHFLRTPSMLRLIFDDTGTFDLHDQGSRIIWYPSSAHQPDVARADFVGRVLPLAQHERGMLALHASAVCIGGRAVGFMAPKNYGKSSLAMALVTGHGAQLLTDDTLLVRPTDATAMPGVHSVRLWAETAGAFVGIGTGRTVLSEKQIFERLPDESLAMTAAPLDALYALFPINPNSEETVRREALDGPAATVSIIQYQKLGALLAGTEATRVFENAATLASRTKVFVLHIVRDFARLPDAARSIAQWHAPTESRVL
ncbi:MAG: hypothetical protein AB1762_08965 [Gemmatimonadota bacterium]